MFLKKSGILLAAAFCLALAGAVAAQDDVVADGLAYPRGLAFDADGNLFVAEPGTGGETLIAEVDGAQITGGLTSQITMIAPDGTTSVALGSLPSAFVPFEGASLGIQRAVPDGETFWLVFSDAQRMLVFSDAIVQVNRATGRVINYIDLYDYESTNDPDGTGEINSNPSDVVIGPDGKLYIVDTGANTLYTWTKEAGLEVLLTWPNTVPTALDFAADGSMYLGFLGEGIAPGAGHVEHWSADASELLETFEGLTAVTDILVDSENNVYATQLVQMGEQGPMPASGSVVKVTVEGFTPVAEGLDTPYALAMDADGNLFVSTGSAFAAPDAGAVIRIPLAQ